MAGQKKVLVPLYIALLAAVNANALGQVPDILPEPGPAPAVRPPEPANRQGDGKTGSDNVVGVEGPPLPFMTGAGYQMAPRQPVCQEFNQRMQECFIGYPGEFAAPPLGAAVDANFRIQVANAEVARTILYHYDFADCSTLLNYRGKEHLGKIIGLLPTNFCPLVIEATPQTPGLDEARRIMVIKELAAFSFPVPPERVVIGTPLTPGLSGREADRIYQNLLNQTQQRGLTGGNSGWTTGGTTTSGGGLGQGTGMTNQSGGAPY
jgi:hypothetical protein